MKLLKLMNTELVKLIFNRIVIKVVKISFRVEEFKCFYSLRCLVFLDLVAIFGDLYFTVFPNISSPDPACMKGNFF